MPTEKTFNVHFWPGSARSGAGIMLTMQVFLDPPVVGGRVRMNYRAYGASDLTVGASTTPESHVNKWLGREWTDYSEQEGNDYRERFLTLLRRELGSGYTAKLM